MTIVEESTDPPQKTVISEWRAQRLRGDYDRSDGVCSDSLFEWKLVLNKNPVKNILLGNYQDVLLEIQARAEERALSN